VPLDHFIARRNALSNNLIVKVFGEEFLQFMNQPASTPPPIGSSPSSTTPASTSTTKTPNGGKKSVEYGPHLPSQQSEEVQQLEQHSWGKEPYGTPGFSWFKVLTRTTVEIILVSILAVLVGMYLNKK
jgi:hypothetical protein